MGFDMDPAWWVSFVDACKPKIVRWAIDASSGEPALAHVQVQPAADTQLGSARPPRDSELAHHAHLAT